MVPVDRALVSSYRLSIVTMSLTAAVWPQFATQVFRGDIGRLTCIGSYVNYVYISGAGNNMFGQLWTQVASVHREYGRLTLATAGLLFPSFYCACATARHAVLPCPHLHVLVRDAVVVSEMSPPRIGGFRRTFITFWLSI